MNIDLEGLERGCRSGVILKEIPIASGNMDDRAHIYQSLWRPI